MRYVNLDWETLGVPSMSDPNFTDKFHGFFEDVVMTYLLTRPE
jgi:hypothetical protein